MRSKKETERPHNHTQPNSHSSDEQETKDIMGKRSNAQGQMRREEYDATQDRSSVAPTGPFDKASSGELKKRRIVSASGSRFAKQTATAAPTPSKSSNPFSGFSFASSGGSMAAPGAAQAPPSQPAKASKNPFQNVMFAGPTSAPSATSTSTSTSNKQPFGSSSFTSKSKPSGSTFGGSAASGTGGRANVNTNTNTNTNVKGDNAAQLERLDNHIFELFSNQSNVSRDLYPPCQQIMATYLALTTKDAPPAKQQTAPAAAPKSQAPPQLFSATTTATQSPAAKSQPASSAKPLFGSSGATTTSLFGASSSASASASTVPFSFGGGASKSAAVSTQPLAPPAPSPSQTSAPATAPTPASPSLGAPPGEASAELESVDDNYNTSLMCKIKIYRMADQYQELVTGMMKFQKHKTNGTHRVIMRNVTGNVQFNMAINSSMTFSAKASKKFGQVTFKGLPEGDEAPSTFTFKCNAPELDALHKKLIEFSS